MATEVPTLNSKSTRIVSADRGIALDSLEIGKPLLATLGKEKLVVIRDESTYHALEATCSHMGGPLNEGLVENGQMRCPWHHARFCLKTGAAVAAPAFKPLRRYTTRIDNNRLFVERSESAALKGVQRLAVASSGRVLIIGAGAAGYACAATLMTLGFKGKLTVLSSERDKPYDRTMCSKEYLAGLKMRADCAMPVRGIFGASKKSQAKLVQQTVARIDPKKHRVTLESGETMGYDVLVLASGADPIKISVPGLDARQVYALRTLRDADAIIKQAKKARSVAIIGASFIGLEAAASLRQRRLKVHVIAPGKVPLLKTLGKAVGTMVQAIHEDKGITFHLGRHVQGYRDKTIILDDGSSFKADFIVVGTGVKPRTQLAQDAGIAVASAKDGGGVIVNARLESSAADVFAIGDIARYPNHMTGKPIRVEHWVHAQRQGQHVARIIMGHSDAFHDVPFFWSAHFSTALSYVGHAEKPQRPAVKGSIRKKTFSVTFTDNAGGKALLSCQQDLQSLRTEARWENDRRARTVRTIKRR